MLARMMGTTAGKSTVIDGVEFRNPVVADAKHMWRLVVNSTLDTNSAYAYMAFCAHFAEECIGKYTVLQTVLPHTTLITPFCVLLYSCL